jgi:hypothetical protein
MFLKYIKERYLFSEIFTIQISEIFQDDAIINFINSFHNIARQQLVA